MKLTYSIKELLCAVSNEHSYTYRKNLNHFTYRRLALGASGKLFLSAICFMLFSFGLARSQSRSEVGTANNQNITALNIGDKIPDELWNLPLQVVNHPDGKKTITLADYKDKLIILDFWATWCVPCIRAFPELAELSNEFKGQLQIVLATSEEQKKIADFLTKRKTPLTSIIEDNFLKMVFPKNSVPHEVWIKDGKVFAITGTYYVNKKTITDVLNGELKSLTEKKVNDQYDRNVPLLVGGNGGNGNDLLFHSVITNYLDGIGSGGTYTDTLGRYKLRALNGTAFQLYSFAARRIDPTITKNRIINSTSVKGKLSNVNPANEVDRANFFCYELIVPKAMEAKAPYMMIEDLNRFFGNKYRMHGKFKKVVIKCWVLKKADQSFSGKTKGGKPEVVKENGILQMINQPFTNYFILLAQANESQSYPFVDKTDINENIDMKILYETQDMEITKELLKTYGLNLTLEDCEIEVLELADIKTNTN